MDSMVNNGEIRSVHQSRWQKRKSILKKSRSLLLGSGSEAYFPPSGRQIGIWSNHFHNNNKIEKKKIWRVEKNKECVPGPAKNFNNSKKGIKQRTSRWLRCHWVGWGCFWLEGGLSSVEVLFATRLASSFKTANSHKGVHKRTNIYKTLDYILNIFKD